MDVYVNLNRAELDLLREALFILRFYKSEFGKMEIDNLRCKLGEYV